MKLQSFALVLAGCLSSVAAQGLGGLPSCAQDCATGSIPSECSLIDVECICAERSFIDNMACCVGQSCEAEDQGAAIDFANGICGGAGITDLPQAATCVSYSSTTTTADETATTTATETSTSDGEATTTISSASSPSEIANTTTEDESTSSESNTATKASTKSSTQGETPTSSETPADTEDTDAAAPLRVKEVGLLAGIAAGIAFLV